MRVKPLHAFVGVCCLAAACQRPVTTGATTMSELQKKLCVPDETPVEMEKHFWPAPPKLPKGVSCLASPVRPGVYRVSSPFRDREHAFRPGGHTGTDFAVPAGTEVRAIAAGTVTYARATDHGVNTVVVRMRSGWKFAVLHLSEIRVNKGDRVRAGDLLGLSGGAVGMPGSGPCTTGPHLHLGLVKDARYTDFEQYLCVGTY